MYFYFRRKECDHYTVLVCVKRNKFSTNRVRKFQNIKNSVFCVRL